MKKQESSNGWERIVCVFLLTALSVTSFAGVMSYVQGDKLLVGGTILVVEFVILERLLKRIW